MPFDPRFRQQVALLLRAIPAINGETCFALKGGTAINLFVRDLPRLSVDIDLTYLTVLPRPRSLGAIDKAMKRIEGRLTKAIPRARISQTVRENTITRLMLQEGRTQIKIEVTPVLRGCVFEPVSHPVCARIEKDFGFAEMRVVSFADLYAGKIVAALDRQHPRDLFDVRDLLANEGVTDNLREAFLIYLISHNRPMAELLATPRKDIAAEFENNFVGMTEEDVPLDDLLDARERMFTAVIANMPAHHRTFLVDFEAGNPDWSTLNVPNAAKLPAVKWRQLNYDRLDRNVRIENVRALAGVLGIRPKPAQLSLFAEERAKPAKKVKPPKARQGGRRSKAAKTSKT